MIEKYQEPQILGSNNHKKFMVISNHIISGNTKFIAHIGFPTDSFTAPKILNPCFKLLNEDLIVVPMACKKEDLKQLIKGLKNLENFFGALITMPHKQEILSYLNYKSDLVELSSSCNILKLNKSREIIGEIFDGKGLLDVICEKGVNLQDKSALLIGAGGVGSAIAFSLCFNGVNRLNIIDLDQSKSDHLCEKIKKVFPKIIVTVWNKEDASWNIIINATPTGGKGSEDLPLAIRYIKSAEVVADLVLSIADTKLVSIARENGSIIISGNEILTAQIPKMIEFFCQTKMSLKEIRTIANFGLFGNS